jgi:deoxyribonuclease-4
LTKNNNQWRAREIGHEGARRFKSALAALGMRHPLAHDSYLINLASPEPALWQRSVEAMADELRRADTLGIPYVVTHPGCHTTATPKQGLQRIIRALDRIHRETRGLQARCLLETTAGQGSSLGWRFEHLAEILQRVRHPDELGVCFDTCHVFAAGYPMATLREYRATMRAFDRLIGVRHIRAFHLNDSARDLGSRVDRHAHIGRGKMGLAPFRFLLNDPRFQSIPMYLETPKGEEAGVDLDTINLRVLRSLRKTP